LQGWPGTSVEGNLTMNCLMAEADLQEVLRGLKGRLMERSGPRVTQPMGQVVTAAMCSGAGYVREPRLCFRLVTSAVRSFLAGSQV
jgi:hypothetical protein